MGQKTKIGKQRKDRFYRLAKETGFRSRAAFKLLQLNRKFGFFDKSRVLIDLCAAPGGWMQVAKQNMPVSSLIVGVDLYPIKPIPGCVTLVEDITTSKCKTAISKALQTWKADIVLNDGAPNVGTNWLFDAYQQTCLTLSALKLATEFLTEGGWFITKVFRSKDYNSLLWVFKQLFKKVQATKPQASRSESAEIFVVCQYYKAPDKLDPKFFQPQYVFQELELKANNTINVFHPKKHKRAKAEGYEENNYTVTHSVKVSEFIKSNNPIELLQKASEIEFDNEEILRHPSTTNEIKECLRDIKLLNRKDVRSILTWWKKLKEETKLKLNKEGEIKLGENITQQNEELTLTDDEEKELNEIDKHIAELEKEELQERKKKKKRVDKERKKLQEKMSLKMILDKNENPGLQEENAIFRLDLIKSGKQLNQVLSQKPEILAASDDESDGGQPKSKKVKYNKEKSYLDASGKFYKEEESASESGDEEGSISSKEGLGLKSESEDDEKDGGNNIVAGKKSDNPLLSDLDYRAKEEKRLSKVALWFEKENFKNLETEADEDYDLDVLSQKLKEKGKKIVGEKKDNAKENIKKEPEDESEPETESNSDDDDDDDESETDRGAKKKKSAAGNSGENSLKSKKRKLNEEGLALGALMVSSQKKKRDLIDGAWNRYAFNDENLPDWFVQDEKENMTREIPVPSQLVNEYKNKLKEINVRPIKKVVEAKARKKRRLMKSLQKAKKKMEAIMDNADISEKEKVRNIQKLYKKAKSKEKKEVTYIVAKKTNTAKRFKRPRGVKGPYKVVDPRLKKDNRRLKRKAKEMKKKSKNRKK